MRAALFALVATAALGALTVARRAQAATSAGATRPTGAAPAASGSAAPTSGSASQAAPPAAPPVAPPATPPAAPLVTPVPSAADAAAQEEPPEQAEPPTLEGRIPPVSGQAFQTAGRVELALGVGLSLDDAFWEKFMPDLSLGYHFDENFYLGLRGGYAFDVGAGRVNACTSGQAGLTCGSPSDAQLKQLPGNFIGSGALAFAWTPLYGKLNFAGEKVVHFDTSLLLDAGILLVRDAAVAAANNQALSPPTTVAPAVAPGLGERFFLTAALALSVELRDLIYADGGTQNQLLLHLGFTLLL